LLANVEADLKSHLLIASACPNRMLVDLYHSRNRLTATQTQPIPITEPARMRDSIGEHRTIVAALRRREAEAAVRAMESHIHNTARCVGVELP
jgi:GntR family transcriptional regulator, transcriptional repressor for pyruvate dehydrogenase complex